MSDSTQDAIIVLPDKIELSGSQAKAFLDALKDLKDCRDKVNAQDEIISGLKSDIKNLQENQEILFGIVSKLKADKLQPEQQNRADVLRALLAANGGKMLAKDARHKMHLGKATFSVLLKAMKDEIDKKPLYSNRSMIIISLK